MEDRLLYGKDETKNVVGLEISNDIAIIFTEDEFGVKSHTVENRFWLLSDVKAQKNWTRLKGNTHYKYGKQFTDRKHWEKTKYFLKNRHDLFSIYDQKESFMVLKGLTYFKGMVPNQVSILSFDIETTSINLDYTAKLLLISNTFRKNGIITKKLFAYDDYNDEGEMIQAWCKWVCEVDPSLMIGHSVQTYDLKYLDFIARKYNVELNLGRNGSAMNTNTYESKFRKDGSQDLHYFKSHIYGREIVDTMFLAIKYDVIRKYPSYGLKPIIKFEGLEKASRTFYDASKIRFNYKDPVEWKKIKEYCEDDSDDSLALFDLMAPTFFEMGKFIPKSFQLISESATGSQINSIMVRSYLQEGHSVPKADEVTEYQGAISFAVPGIYRNMMKIDFSGLYPSIMRQFKVYNKEKDPNGNFLELVNYFAEYRLKYKKLYKETKNKSYDDVQQACKIFANSMYGFLSTNGINFNYPGGASFITGKARELLTTSILWATGKEFEYWNNLFIEKTE